MNWEKIAYGFWLASLVLLGLAIPVMCIIGIWYPGPLFPYSKEVFGTWFVLAMTWFIATCIASSVSS